MSRDRLQEFLTSWRHELREELRTNSRGYLGRKNPSLAKSVPETFPDIDVLLSYTHPITSESKGKGPESFNIDWEKEPDLGRVAGLCEMYFEWGIKEIIIKRFRTVLWPSAVLRILRRAVLLDDKKTRSLTERKNQADVLSTPRKTRQDRPIAIGTPSKMIARHFSALQLGTPSTSHNPLDSDDDDSENERLIVKIHSSRTHASTDGVLEYRLEIAPSQLVHLCEAGVKGLRTAISPVLESSDDAEDDSDGDKGKTKTKKPPPDPQSHLRIWLPACMVRIVEPNLVEDFEETVRRKEAKKTKKSTTKGKSDASSRGQPKPQKAKTRQATSTTEESGTGVESEQDSHTRSLYSDDELDQAKIPSLDLSTLRHEEEESASSASETPRKPLLTVNIPSFRQRNKNISPTGIPSTKRRDMNTGRTNNKETRTSSQTKDVAPSKTAKVASLFDSASRINSTSQGRSASPLEDSSDDDSTRVSSSRSSKGAQVSTRINLSHNSSATSDIPSTSILSKLSSKISLPEKNHHLSDSNKRSPSKAPFVPRPFPFTVDTSASYNNELSDSSSEASQQQKATSSRRHSPIPFTVDLHHTPLPHVPQARDLSDIPKQRGKLSSRTDDISRASSLRRHPSRSIAAERSVIVISSDSDNPPMAPLLVAKAKAKAPIRARRKNTQPVDPCDIIDLT